MSSIHARIEPIFFHKVDIIAGYAIAKFDGHSAYRSCVIEVRKWKKNFTLRIFFLKCKFHIFFSHGFISPPISLKFGQWIADTKAKK